MTHRSLNFATFVSSIPPELLKKYLEHFEWARPLDGWATMNPEMLQRVLDEPEHTSLRDLVLEDFRRMNDLCGRGANLLVSAYRRAGSEMPPDRPTQECAMRLFLEAKEAFEFAWSQYLMFGGTAKVSSYQMALPNGEISSAQADALKSDLAAWFRESGKGEECELKRFDDSGATVLLISRGTYRRTVAYWERDRVSFMSFRPASEDVLLYDHKLCQLMIKASLRKDREHYLTAFATHIGGDPRLADEAAGDSVFSLRPLELGTFDYAGNDVITSVDLVKVKMDMQDTDGCVITVASDDVRRSSDRYGPSLGDGRLTFARFRFHLRLPGKRPAKVTFEVEPPGRTDLAQKPHSQIIESYLSEQKVKLA